MNDLEIHCDSDFEVKLAVEIQKNFNITTTYCGKNPVVCLEGKKTPSGAYHSLCSLYPEGCVITRVVPKYEKFRFRPIFSGIDFEKGAISFVIDNNHYTIHKSPKQPS